MTRRSPLLRSLRLFDPGVFGIGDSLSDDKLKLRFEDFPVFPPEIFARVQPKDSLKRKQFEKGILQLSQEGAIQVFRQKHVGLESFIVGVVGQLQLEVLEYRLRNEYNAPPKTMEIYLTERKKQRI